MQPGDRVHMLTLVERVRIGRRAGWARAVTEPANAEISARSRIGRLATQARRRAA